MQAYGMRDVHRILRLTPARVRSLVAHGFVTPMRGPRKAWRFSFQDLILLRAARALELANVAPRRIHRALGRLRAQLPEGLPITGLTIRASGEQVVVHDGRRQWLAETGQYVLEFAVVPAREGVRVLERPRPTRTAAEWFDRAQRLEGTDPDGARAAYRHAIELEPDDPAAYVNLGRLLHDAGALVAAEAVYREGLAHGARDASLSFNLALVLEDLGDVRGAIRAYEDALAAEPAYADAHFNVARLWELAGDLRRALRHLSAYRRLVRGSPRT